MFLILCLLSNFSISLDVQTIHVVVTCLVKMLRNPCLRKRKGRHLIVTSIRSTLCFEHVRKAKQSISLGPNHMQEGRAFRLPLPCAKTN
ncbi:hypothetical protein DENSPDRAFT_399576 [Dentipellis sp. KUC8613]|nr:hypothetical protein DENSPDRAFT_399576 [Dentipellis sp. KUC8613]